MLATAVLAYITKLKRGLGLTFGAHFLHDFPIKCSLFDTLVMEKISMPRPISFLRYETKRVIKFWLIQLKVVFRYIFASLFGISKREHFRNKEKCFFSSNSQAWNTKHILLNYLGIKSSLVMKFGQFMQYYKIIFYQRILRKMWAGN